MVTSSCNVDPRRNGRSSGRSSSATWAARSQVAGSGGAGRPRSGAARRRGSCGPPTKRMATEPGQLSVVPALDHRSAPHPPPPPPPPPRDGQGRRARARARPRREAAASGTPTATSTSTRPPGSGSRTSGHGRVEIADAVAAQLRTLAAHHVFGDHANEPALELAERVADSRPSRTPRSSSEAAAARRRHGREDRSPLLGARRAARANGHRLARYAYHGTNAYGTSLSGIPAVRDGYGTLVEDVAEVRTTTRRRSRTLDELGGRAAAFIGEPMIGAGGVDPAAGRLLARGRADLPRARGVLLVADEVISGFGRLGRWFGCERYGFTPDLMTCAKGISSGYVPLGRSSRPGVCARRSGGRTRRRSSRAERTRRTRAPASRRS